MASVTTMFNTSDIQLLYKTAQEKFPYNFATCNLSINSGEPLFNILHFVFSLDRSGSMGAGSSGQDGRTAWDNLVHTMRNIFQYFKQSNIQVFVSVILFDHIVEEECHSLELTDESIRVLTETLAGNKYYPRGMTNIAGAMAAAKKAAVHDFDTWCTGKSYKTFHLFMTDGCPTEGPSTAAGIVSYMPQEVENFMIGFGKNHNEKLMTDLVKQSVCGGEYHFVSTFEQAGVVYGTILDSICNRYAEDVTITVKNCEIYDFTNNTWGQTFQLGSMAFESERMLHLRFPWDNTEDKEVCVTYKTVGDSQKHTVWKYEREYSDQKNPDEKQNDEVYKYLLRQEVLEVLDAVKQKSLATDKLRTNITTLGELIKVFQKENKLDDDAFLNQLCDDLTVALHSLEMAPELAAKYVVDRQNAQATQRGYTATMPQYRNVTAPAACALEKTPLFRGHTCSAVDRPFRTTSAYTCNRQAAAQRLCTQGLDSDDDDDVDGFHEVLPYHNQILIGRNSVNASTPPVPPRPVMRRAATASAAPVRTQTSPTQQARDRTAQNLVTYWVNQAKKNKAKKKLERAETSN